MRFRDALGNTTSSDVSDTIFFDCGDVTPPVVWTAEIYGWIYSGSCFWSGTISFRTSVSDNVDISNCYYTIWWWQIAASRDSQNPGICSISFIPSGNSNVNFIASDSSSNFWYGTTGIFTRDIAAPNTPSMVAEPAYSPGTTNMVVSNIVIDNSCAWWVEYQFCISTANNSSNCSWVGLSSWSTNNFASFWWLTNETTYFYFVKSKDSFNNESVRSTSTSSIQDTIPPTCSFIDNVEFWPVWNDYIEINAGGATNLKRKYNDNTSCPTSSWEYLFSATSWTETTQENNNKYVCIYASDDAGNYCTEYSANSINVDDNDIVLSFDDPVSSTWVSNDGIVGNWWLIATVRKWTYDADGVCPAPLSWNYTYRSTDSMNQNNESRNGQYICLFWSDGIKSTTLSSYPQAIKVDNSTPWVPTLTCSNFANNTCNNYTWSISCSINDTGGPSPITTEYNTGWWWINNWSGLSFYFIPGEGTTTVQMRITDAWWSATSNLYTIQKDTTWPTVSFVWWSSDEGTQWTRTTSDYADIGCAWTHANAYAYEDDGIWSTRTSTTTYTINAPGYDWPFNKTIYVKARDGLNNESISYPATRTRNNVAPTAHAITINSFECSTGILTQDTTDPRPGENIISSRYANPSCSWWPIGLTTDLPIYQPEVWILSYSYFSTDDDSWFSSCTWATIIFNNVEITANAFSTWSIWSWAKSYNWRIGSNASAWSCETISATIETQGTKWTSIIVGDTITYTPNSNQTWSDTVTLRITDGDTFLLRNISFDWIDTINPTTTITPNGVICTGQDINVSLNCNDDSWCSESNYKVILGGASCDEIGLNIGNSFTVPWTEGNYSQLKVCYRSRDNAWNIEAIKTSNNFNIDKIGPDAPVLNTPSSWAEIGVLTPSFWRSNSTDVWCGTTSWYYLGIYTDASCTTLSQWNWTNTTTYTISTPLANNQTYYRKVVAQDIFGNTWMWSECMPFTINNEAFTVSLSKSIGDYFNTGGFVVTGTFSHATSDFDIGDINITNGTISNFLTITGNIYTRQVLPTLPEEPTPSKVITLSIPQSVAYNETWTWNRESNILTATYDNVAAIISINNPDTSPASSKSISATANEGTLTMTAADTNTTCNATRSFIAYQALVFSSEADNGKYVCYRAIDNAWNTTYTLSNMISGIDTSDPIITINNPDPNPASSKTISATINEGTLTMTNPDTNTTCDATRSFIAYQPVTLNSESYNGNYICYRAIDSAWNTTYILSNMISGIDTSTPVITINNPDSSPASSKTISATVNDGTLTMTVADTNTSCDVTRSFIAYQPMTLNSESYNGRYICYRAINGVGNTTYTLSNMISGIDTTPPNIQEITPIPNTTADTTPEYTFSSSEAWTIIYWGSCWSPSTNAIVGNNTITFNPMTTGTYNDCTIRVNDSAGNLSNILTISPFTIDTDMPVIQQISAIPTPTNNTTPSYSFTSSKSWTIIYWGSCSSNTTTAQAGNNTIVFNSLAAGTYTNCTIQVSDVLGNLSNILAINEFVIDTTAPILSSITPIPTIGNNPSPAYTFASTETGTIFYSWSCTSTTTTAYITNNTITLNILADGTYSNCRIRVADNVGNQSNRLAINPFTIDTVAPIITQISWIQGDITNPNPSYIFSANEVWTISYAGSCPIATTNAISGNNTITFNLINTGTYADCSIRVSDLAGNLSNQLIIGPFTLINSDTSPEDFTFARIENARRWRIYRSNTISITGLSQTILVQWTLSWEGIIYVNNINTSTGALVKNWDIIYLELRASDNYETSKSITLTIWDKQATFTVITEIENDNPEDYVLSEDDIIVLEEIYRMIDTLDNTLKIRFKDMLEKAIDDLEEGGENPIAVIKLRYIYNLLIEDINNTKDIIHIAPNGKVYIIVERLWQGYTSANFLPSNKERYYKTLTEIKAFIDRNNRSWTLNFSVDETRNAATHITPNGKAYSIYRTTTQKYIARGMTIPTLFDSLQELKQHLDKNNQKK
jgi:hypothetical protein